MQSFKTFYSEELGIVRRSVTLEIPRKKFLKITILIRSFSLVNLTGFTFCVITEV